MASPKLFKLLFEKKKQSPESDGERHPINLPEVPEDQFNAVGIAEILRGGSAIWAWYDLQKKYNIKAFENLAGGAIDAFAVFRLEGEYLVKYVVYIDDEFHLRLSEIQRATNSNVVELFNADLKEAYRVYYDPDGLTENTKAFVHDVTDEMVEEELQTKRVFVVTDEHFIKKETA